MLFWGGLNPGTLAGSEPVSSHPTLTLYLIPSVPLGLPLADPARSQRTGSPECRPAVLGHQPPEHRARENRPGKAERGLWREI